MKQNADILDIINRLKTSGFEIVSMSGSGSTVFAISNRKLPYKTYKKIINPKNYDLVGEYKIIK
jgi:4-diphosphocytidyl-2C-methyl-D-erythritol kinase